MEKKEKKVKEYKVMEGMEAPHFTLPGSDGKDHSLKDYRGKKVILYFYPKDNTPGCSVEAEGFRDRHEDIRGIDAEVIGISRDSLKSHDRFIEKFSLPFVLLSDEGEEVVNLYGVLKEKTMFGKKVMGIERTTYILDEEGKVVKVYRKPKTEGHADEVLEFIKGM